MTLSAPVRTVSLFSASVLLITMNLFSKFPSVF
jgi:hypothetical protein